MSDIAIIALSPSSLFNHVVQTHKMNHQLSFVACIPGCCCSKSHWSLIIYSFLEIPYLLSIYIYIHTYVHIPTNTIIYHVILCCFMTSPSHPKSPPAPKNHQPPTSNPSKGLTAGALHLLVLVVQATRQHRNGHRQGRGLDVLHEDAAGQPGPWGTGMPKKRGRNQGKFALKTWRCLDFCKWFGNGEWIHVNFPPEITHGVLEKSPCSSMFFQAKNLQL